MVQNQHDRKFCDRCQRNVFPARPKPNFILILSLFILIIPGLIYLIIYGLKPQNRCPICSSVVSYQINYHYPPFRDGDPNSYDPTLIGGTVIRSETTIMDPEGVFVDFIPPRKNSPLLPPSPREYCNFCGNEFHDVHAEKCPNCGTSR